MPVSMKSRGGRPAPLINVTPLIDVVLVLLITFMVIAPSLEPNLDVGLSAIVRQPSAEVPNQLLLELGADGSLVLSGEPVARGELHDRLVGALSHRDERILFFRADPESVYGDVVSVLDVARAAGAEDIGTVVEASVGEAGAR